MKRISDWLKNEWKGWKLLFGPLICLAVMLAYLKLIMLLKISFFQSLIKPTPPPLTFGIIIVIVISYLLAALWEELVFRVPITFIVHSGGESKLFLPSIIVLSAVFGYCHGSVYNILLQGVHGLIFSLVFLKTGGLNNIGLGTLRAWLITTAIHASYNVLLSVFPQFLLC